MPPSRELLAALSLDTRFRADGLEKVLRLIELLREVDRHPVLRPRLVLKGGTALNLFHLDFPRISVDLDFNYVGRVDREGMLEERQSVEAALEQVARSLGYPAQRLGLEEVHAGTRWAFAYGEVGGSSDHLELSVNWLHRVPLLPAERRRLHRLHPAYDAEATLLALPELYAGKVAALIDRAHPRDLFDVAMLLSSSRSLNGLAPRGVTLFYLAFGRQDPRKLRTTNLVRIPERLIHRFLYPLLRQGVRPSRDDLFNTVLPVLDTLLDLSEDEETFFESLYRGELRADLLFGADPIRARAQVAPPMAWKLLNIRENLAGRIPPVGRRRGRPPRRA